MEHTSMSNNTDRTKLKYLEVNVSQSHLVRHNTHGLVR